MRIRHDSGHQTNVIRQGLERDIKPENRELGIISFNDLLSVSSYWKSGRRWTILSRSCNISQEKFQEEERVAASLIIISCIGQLCEENLILTFHNCRDTAGYLRPGTH